MDERVKVIKELVAFKAPQSKNTINKYKDCRFSASIKALVLKRGSKRMLIAIRRLETYHFFV